jgi:hypothetical protein
LKTAISSYRVESDGDNSKGKENRIITAVKLKEEMGDSHQYRKPEEYVLGTSEDRPLRGARKFGVSNTSVCNFWTSSKTLNLQYIRFFALAK